MDTVGKMSSTTTTTYSAILCSLLNHRWEERGLTQRDFFAQTGIASGTWSRMVRGLAHFHIEDLRAACEVLGWSVGEITTEADRVSRTLKEQEKVKIPSKADLRANDGAPMGYFVAG
ncbi:MAG: helix-turn-helix domain-containing protein, partial [Paracoccaceae bacterium]